MKPAIDFVERTSLGPQKFSPVRYKWAIRGLLLVLAWLPKNKMSSVMLPRSNENLEQRDSTDLDILEEMGCEASSVAGLIEGALLIERARFNVGGTNE